MKQDVNGSAINILKIVASLMVMTIHVSAINFPKLGKTEWDISNAYNAFSRICVPIFFMISGYFLLARNESTSSFYRRRFTKIFPPLLFWSVVFYFFNHFYLGAQYFNPLELLNRPASAHLWYLYATLGLYLFIPFLSKIYRNSNRSERLLFLLIWFISSSILPTCNALFGMQINPGLFQATSITGYIGLIFIGAWIRDNPLTKRKSLAVALLCSYVICSYLTMTLTKDLSTATGKPSQIFYNYLSPFVIIAAVTLFYFFLTLPLEGPFIRKVGEIFSSFALGVYCIHTIFIGVMAKEFHIGGDVTPVEYYTVLTVMYVFVLSCITSFVFSKIPVIKRVF